MNIVDIDINNDDNQLEEGLPLMSLSNIIKNNVERVNSCGCYGTIWIDKKNRIVKIQMLQTGAYFNKTLGKYYDKDHNEISNKEAKKNYDTDKFAKLFINKQSISLEEFKKETDIHIFMAKNKISPRIYSYGITKLINGFQYGIVIMKRMTNVLSHNLNIKNMDIVVDKIKQMHILGYYHGDLQTCNIGIEIENNEITKCRIFDWFYANKLSDNNEEKKKYIDSDFKLYKKRGGII